MEDKLCKDSGPTVGKSSMPENKFLKLTKFFQGEVTGERGLHTFLAFDADTAICLQDHADVVTTIADTCDALAAREGAH